MISHGGFPSRTVGFHHGTSSIEHPLDDACDEVAVGLDDQDAFAPDEIQQTRSRRSFDLASIWNVTSLSLGYS